MARPLIYLFSFCVVALVAAPLAWAQRSGSGGFGTQQQVNQGFGQQQQGFGQGGFGQQQMGSGVTNNTGSSRTSGMFGNQVGGGANSTNSFGGGSSAFGSSSSGQSSQGQQSAAGAQQLTGTERYTREGRQPGAFVGADNADAANLMSQMQGNMMSSLQGMQGMQGNNQMNQFNQMNRGGQNTNNRVQVRATLKLGSEFRPSARSTSPAAVAKVQARIAKTPALRKLGPIQLSMEGRTAVLRGTVESEHARALAEKVALLEPGISAVQNDLTVGPAASTEQTGN